MPNPVDDSTQDAIMQHHAAGMNRADIAHLVGVAHATVTAVLRRNGIDVTSRSTLGADDEMAIIELYQDGHSVHTIAKQLNRADSTIRRVLSNRGILQPSAHARLKERWPQIRDEVIAEFRRNPNQSAAIVAQRFGVKPHWIRARLRDVGIEGQGDNAILHREIDSGFFDKIDTEHKAYLYGLLTADGNLKGNQVSIGLKHDDAPILVECREAIGSSHPITVSKRSPSFANDAPGYVATWKFKNARLAKALRLHGFEEAKTGSEKLPELAPHLERHMLRGVFDGDGSIYWNSAHQRWGLQVTIGESVCRRFEALAERLCPGSSGTIEPIHDGATWKWSTAGPVVASRLADALYSDAQIALSRKAQLANLAMSRTPPPGAEGQHPRL